MGRKLHKYQSYKKFIQLYYNLKNTGYTIWLCSWWRYWTLIESRQNGTLRQDFIHYSL